MKKVNKLLISLILISSLLLSIGYSAINNITLDIEGKVVAIPTTRILATGEEFNKILKNATSTTTADTTITKIVFDYWMNGYSENGVVVFEESDWGKGIPIDVDGLGGIKLFKSDDGTKAYILSETEIYANQDCSSMFYYLEAVTEFVFNNLDTSKVKKFYRFFEECNMLQNVDVSSFNTENATNMQFMFGKCEKLISINGLNKFKTSNVINMHGMFYGLSSLTTLDLSSFNTSNVKSMISMFHECKGLTRLDLSNFDTSKVEDMSNMFLLCTNLEKLDISGFDTQNTTKMYQMFAYCYTLSEIDVSNFNTSKVTTMERMFNGCKVTNLDLSSFNTSNVTNMTKMFTNNTNLKTIYVSDKWNIEKVNHIDIVDEDQPFLNCRNLVGGAGTTYDSNNVDITYARIDGGPDSETPGYLTLKTIN